jgi:hypothetical protein
MSDFACSAVQDELVQALSEMQLYHRYHYFQKKKKKNKLD